MEFPTIEVCGIRGIRPLLMISRKPRRYCTTRIILGFEGSNWYCRTPMNLSDLPDHPQILWWPLSWSKPNGQWRHVTTGLHRYINKRACVSANGFQPPERIPSHTEAPSASPNREASRDRWPTPFDTGGACYIFDTSTGFYYDTQTAFYYDSGTRLYYSSFMKKYLRHTPETQPPFTEYTPPPPEVSTPAQSEREQMNPHGVSVSKAVSFHITGKPKQRPSGPNKTKHSKVIEKWTKAQSSQSTVQGEDRDVQSLL